MNTQLPDFKDLPLEDLENMQKNLSKFIEKRLDQKKKDALDEIRAIVKHNDLSYEEVNQVIRTTTRRGKAPPVYRNPDNPRQTWSGKGQAPAWFASHPDPEKLRIPGA